MDPASFGFVAVIAVLITVISVIVFKMYPKETDFEQAYGKNALRLLTENRTTKTKNAKSKSKWKIGEKKKDFGAEEKQNRNEELANGDLIYTSLSNGHCGAKELSGRNSGEDDAKANHKKPQSKQLVFEIKQQTESVKDGKASLARSVDDSFDERLNDRPDLPHTAVVLHDETKIGERKVKKKNRGRRNDEHMRGNAKEEISVTEETIPVMEDMKPLESEEKKFGKMKIKRDLKDLNANKLQARLTAVAELEPEYITFLANYIDNVNTQRAKLNNEIALMKKQIADKDRLVLQCTNKLTAAEQKDSKILMLQKALAEEKRKYKLFEQTVCSQLNNNAQEKSHLQRKYDQLQGEFGALREEMKKAQTLIRSAPPPVDTKSYQQQIDRLKSELTSSKNHCSQQELELNQRLQTLQQIRKELENQDCQIEHLTKTNALLEKRLQDVEDNAKTERDALEMKLQNTMKVAEELSVVTSEIRDEMLQQRGNVETAVQEREKHCEQIHILNAQLMDANRERVRYLNDCAAYNKKLTEMENANTELSNQLEELKKANATSDANCSELTKEVEKYRKQLVDVMEARDKDIALLRDELQSIQKEKENYVKQMSVDISNEATEVAKCRKELNEFKDEYHKKLNFIVSLEEELAKYREIGMKREALVSSCDDDVAKVDEKIMKRVVQPVTSDFCGGNVNIEINELKKRNEELRMTNYKIVEISQQQEATFKKHLEEMEKNHVEAFRQYCYNVFNTLRVITPPDTKLPNLATVHDTSQFSKWLKDVENVIGKTDKSNKNEYTDNKMNLTKVVELEASNRRYRAALVNLSSHIDVIEQEVISKEKLYFSEISRLRREMNEQLKKQLENEHKRKLELISQASKLCEVINGTRKLGNEGTEPRVKNGNAYDLSGANYD